MSSRSYELFATALLERKQVVCLYDGYRRELCPVILGHTKGEEAALVYQFAGESRSGLPAGGSWKCLRLAKTGDVQLREGAWIAGDSHQRAQACVEDVDFDVNPESPYNPRRPSTPTGGRRR
ncbi:MAG TPA: hypothetical protein VGF71_11680 [Caulobacteraceae bacterium]|jgi:hypothetical protein